MPSPSRKIKRRREKLPVRKGNIKVILLSLLTLFLLIFFAAGPLDLSNGALVRWIAGALFIIMIINLILLIAGIRDFPGKEYRRLFRVLAIILPAVSLGAYIITYLIGFFI